MRCFVSGSACAHSPGGDLCCAFPAGFYTGTEIWSLNWWLRTITGILFGVGVVWFAYPLLHEGMQEIAEETRQAIARTQKQLRIQTRG